VPAHGFTLPIYVDLGATFLFALTGALAAMRRGYDIVGLLALALVVGVGGGLLRDGLFIQKGPPAVTTDARYLLAVLAACALAILMGDRVSRFRKVIDFADALGLGAYAVVGAQKSLEAGLSVPAAMLVGVINACGGSVVRDILTREEPLLFKPGQFYALAATLGSAVYTLLVIETRLSPIAAAWMAIAITFIFRALAIHFDWKTTAVLDLIRRIREQPPQSR
jgi:uncharacterized membrane protein YeiH